jgi:hypothetical protein
MNNKERTTAILAKIRISEDAREKQESEDNARASQAAAVQKKVELAWVPLNEHLGEFIQALNKDLPKDTRIFVRKGDFSRNDYVDSLNLSFDQYLTSAALRRCNVTVDKTGIIAVRLGNATTMPVKDFNFSALTATNDQVESFVLDFLEANI